MNEDVIAIFSVAESYFLPSTMKLQNKMVSRDIVSALMENCTVLESFAKVRSSSPDNIKKEIAFSLLEDLLTLYIRVRKFSLVKAKFRISKSEKAKQNQDLPEHAQNNLHHSPFKDVQDHCEESFLLVKKHLF